MMGWLEDVQLHGAHHFERWIEGAESVRASAARLLNAQPEEVAFVKNTSEGISLFASGLEWQKGDEVVSIEGEFPANYYPWKALERWGVRLRLVEQKNGEIPLASIATALTHRTKVVAVSFVQFLSGYRFNLEELGELCAAHGALLFVDAIQGWGAFPIDVKAAKIAGLAACGHKWLLGPMGCAVLFVRRDLAERMSPATAGWLSVKGWEEFKSGDLLWRDGAGRFETGAPNMAGIYGLGAALDLLTEVGMDATSARILELTDRLRAALTERGFRIYGPETGEARSGIVTFKVPNGDAEATVERLESRGVMVSVRSAMVRISPHFYNTKVEIDRVLDSL
jgi:cysteine desulfurase / selenocysteine lyase